MNNSLFSWLDSLKRNILGFLSKLQDTSKPGYFKYSLTGDIYLSQIRWGLGNAVFASNSYYMLDALDRVNLNHIAEFIKSFQDEKGYIFDRTIERLSRFRRFVASIKKKNYVNLFSKLTKVAETRQAFSSLILLGSKPKLPYLNIPYTFKGVEKYLNMFNWSKPWGAGSHFSHLLFFYNANKTLFNIHHDLADKLIDYAIDYVNKMQSKEDGAWYKGNNVTLQQKINGAMKVITGLKVVNKVNFRFPEKLINLALGASNNAHACDNFNIVYVLKYANELTESNYRYKEIKDFCLNRLEIYKNYYYPEFGGFSFLPKKANVYYYEAKITKGLNEPDIHGTCLFLWGISIIVQILGIDKELGFNELIP